MIPFLAPELERLIREAVDRGASNLHLVPGEAPTLRIHGKLLRMDVDALSTDKTREMATQLIGDENVARIGAEVGEFQRSCSRPGEFNLSVAVARSGGGYSLAFRIMLPIIPGVKDIALPEAVVRASASSSGLIVFAGLAGSGKTNALYSLIDYINATSPLHICTVENPAHLYITPKQALVQQREIGLDIPTRLSGIQAAMAQDLDVLLVGEIATVEELQACVTVAETGHLVLTQIHAESPEGAVCRMLDIFPDDMRPAARNALASQLVAVCAQRLLPRADRRGRVAAYGVLIPDVEMRTAIASGSDFMARKNPLPSGCQTMAEHAERLLEAQIISDKTARTAK